MEPSRHHAGNHVPRRAARRWGLAIAALLLFPGPRALAAGAGYWHTSGNQILDANGKVVRIAGINWYGFETADKVIHGLWCQDYHTIINTIKAQGFNVVRMPFSNDLLEHPITPGNIGASNGSGPTNRDVLGSDSLTIMDEVIRNLGAVGIRVILDNHRSDGGNSAQENGLWYTSAFSEKSLIDDWVAIVKRYSSYKDPAGNPVVIGADLRNEPHLMISKAPTGACWTGDSAAGGCPSTSATNWPKAAERIGEAVLAVNPNLLIIVEGNDCYENDCDWWGGNLLGVAKYPVVLSVPNRLVYSAHDYGPNLYKQKWFNDSTTCDSLAATWDKYWGYISAQGIAPVLVGEFGANNGDFSNTSAPGSQGQWITCLGAYIKARPALNWTYWALNGEDDYAYLSSQYETTPPSSAKKAMLAAMQFPLEGGGGVACATPNIPTNFMATAVSANQVDLKWTAVAPPSTGCTITYRLFRSTSSSLTASDATLLVSGITGSSYSDTSVVGSTNYYYLLEAEDVTTTSPPSSKQSANTPQGGTTTCSAAPSAPSGLTATAASAGQINLAWSAVTPPAACTVSYSVYRSTTSGFTPSTANRVATGLTAASFASTGLAGATTYYYLVQAVDAAGSSPSSAQASATTASAPDTQAPSAPAALASGAVTTTTVALTWTASTDDVGVTTYDLYGGATKLGSSPTAGATISNLTPGTTYTFSVKARDAAGNVSAASNAVVVTTLPSVDVTPPSAPGNLVWNATGLTVTLSWQPATDDVGVVAFDLYYGSFYLGSFGETSLALIGFKAGTPYVFTVKARDAAGNVSVASNQATVLLGTIQDTTPPSAPSRLAASAVGATSVTLAWTASTDDVGVVVYQVSQGGAVVRTVTTTSTTVSGLSPGTGYTFSVTALDAAGNVSVASDPLAIVTGS
jgi:endoglucanase